MGKAETMWCEKSDEVIVPMMAIDNRTLPKGRNLYFDYALVWRYV
jgi:hypothetical protein